LTRTIEKRQICSRNIRQTKTADTKDRSKEDLREGRDEEEERVSGRINMT